MIVAYLYITRQKPLLLLHSSFLDQFIPCISSDIHVVLFSIYSALHPKIDFGKLSSCDNLQVSLFLLSIYLHLVIPTCLEQRFSMSPQSISKLC